MGLIGDVTPGITALSAQLPTIIQTLTTAGHDDIAQLLGGVQVEFDKLISGELAIVKAVEDPLLERADRFVEKVDRVIDILGKFEGFANGFDINVTPKGKEEKK